MGIPIEYEYRLNKLRELKENWNSYGAKPITLRAIYKAAELLQNLFIAPTSDGGIQIEIGRGSEIIIDINPDGTINKEDQ